MGASSSQHPPVQPRGEARLEAAPRRRLVALEAAHPDGRRRRFCVHIVGTG